MPCILLLRHTIVALDYLPSSVSASYVVASGFQTRVYMSLTRGARRSWHHDATRFPRIVAAAALRFGRHIHAHHGVAAAAAARHLLFMPVAVACVAFVWRRRDSCLYLMSASKCRHVALTNNEVTSVMALCLWSGGASSYFYF